MNHVSARLAAFILACLVTTAAMAADGVRSSDSPGQLLAADNFWRCYVVRGTETFRTKDGQLVPVLYDTLTERVGPSKRNKVTQLRKHEADRLFPAPPPADWAAADFDDGGFGLLRGPFFAAPHKPDGSIYRSVPAIYLRGRFELADPAAVGDLTLSLTFHGGAIVYINGRELARKHLPAGAISTLTPADDYPTETFLDAEEFLLPAATPATGPEDVIRRCRARLRSIDDLAVPASMLRKGVNVLAIEIHRAPMPEFMVFAKQRTQAASYFIRRYGWPRAGLAELTLKPKTASGQAAVAAEAARFDPAAPRVVNWPISQDLWSFGASIREPLSPVRLAIARNGVCSGQVLVCSGGAIRNLTAQCSELAGQGGSIPAANVQVRYRIDAPPRCNYAGTRPDTLEALSPEPPAETAVGNLGPLAGRDLAVTSLAVQPIWFTVRVPADAKPGEYRGTATVSADGLAAVRVPISLRVIDYRLPDSRDFFTEVGLFQSPESVAMQYNVAMWSDEHWRLIERTFQLMGELGVKEVYIPAVRGTHLGNEQSMIRYRRDGGKLTPDFAIVDRYLSIAGKHIGRPAIVCLYAWEHTGGGHFPSHLTVEQRVEFERKALLSLVGPDGKLSDGEGFAWGSAESKQFWKSVCDGLKPILARNGLAGSLMLGIAGDYCPSEQALGDLAEASGNAPWVRQTHSSTFSVGGKPGEYKVGYLASAWGGAAVRDPDMGRCFGWQAPAWKLVTREFPGHSGLQRFYLESKVTGSARIGAGDFGLRGAGRMGADFWPVLGGEKGRKVYLFGRYPETAWGQLNVCLWMPAFFAPSRDGAIHTVRSEMFRENIQEIEARIFLEKALADGARRAALGDDLASRAQQLLDARTRISQATVWQYSCDWTCTMASDVEGLSARLYDLAVEAAAKLAD